MNSNKLQRISVFFGLLLFQAGWAQPASEIPSGMSTAEVEAYRSGRPYNEILPAETYGYPDPRQILEWQNQLELSDEQLKKIRALANRMVKECVLYGKKIIANELLLDEFFRKGETDPMALANRVESIGLLRWRLRFNLLSICTSTKTLLDDQQLKRYRELHAPSLGSGVSK